MAGRCELRNVELVRKPKKNKDRVIQVPGSGDRQGDIMGKRGHGQESRNSE